MLGSKLLELLAHFSISELKRFKLFVDSPYYNNQEAIRLLLDYLMGYAPRFNSTRITYNNAYAFVYGDKSIRSDPQTAIQKIMSKLLALLKEFALQTELEEDSVQRSLALARFFTKRQILDQVPKAIEEAKAHLGESTCFNEAYYRYNLQIEIDQGAFLNLVVDKASLDYNLSQQIVALDKYYAITKLQTYCFARIATYRNNYDFDFSQVPAFLHWLEHTGFLDDKAIHIWYRALNLLLTPTFDSFNVLKKDIVEQIDILDAPTKRVLYSFLATMAPSVYPVREQYLRAMFEIYREQIEKDILYINGYLSPVLLRNITVIGLKQKAFEWVERFLEQNAQHIVPSYLEREDILSLCWAYLYFEKGAFMQALEKINTLRYESIFTKMDERRLRLMCYYELGINDPFDDLINSFRKFLTEHKTTIPMPHLKANRLFINYIHRLLFIHLIKKDQIRALHEEISQIPVLPEKEWLLLKLDERLS